MHAVASPAIFGLLSWAYFRRFAWWSPLRTAPRENWLLGQVGGKYTLRSLDMPAERLHQPAGVVLAKRKQDLSMLFHLQRNALCRLVNARGGRSMALAATDEPSVGRNLDERGLRGALHARRARMVEAIPQAGPAGERAERRHLDEILVGALVLRRADDDRFDLGDLERRIAGTQELRVQQRGEGARGNAQKRAAIDRAGESAGHSWVAA